MLVIRSTINWIRPEIIRLWTRPESEAVNHIRSPLCWRSSWEGTRTAAHDHWPGRPVSNLTLSFLGDPVQSGVVRFSRWSRALFLGLETIAPQGHLPSRDLRSFHSIHNSYWLQLESEKVAWTRWKVDIKWWFLQAQRIFSKCNKIIADKVLSIWFSKIGLQQSWVYNRLNFRYSYVSIHKLCQSKFSLARLKRISSKKTRFHLR